MDDARRKSYARRGYLFAGLPPILLIPTIAILATDPYSEYSTLAVGITSGVVAAGEIFAIWHLAVVLRHQFNWRAVGALLFAVIVLLFVMSWFAAQY